jgi:hypothetical protein
MTEEANKDHADAKAAPADGADAPATPADVTDAKAAPAEGEAEAERAETSDAADTAEDRSEPETEDEPETAAEPKTSVQESTSKGDDEDAAVLDANGRERPRFLLGFPDDPELKRLAAAFEAGNYALVRAEAEALAERTESRAVRDAALELRRRIAPDPLAKYLLALTAALLLSLSYWAYHH